MLHDFSELFLLNAFYVRNENCTIYGAVVDFTVFISEHPKNKCLFKPHLLRCGGTCFFDYLIPNQLIVLFD